MSNYTVKSKQAHDSPCRKKIKNKLTFFSLSALMVPAGEWLTLLRKPTPLGASPSAARVSGAHTNTQETHTHTHTHKDSTAWPAYFCFHQFGTMTTTCASLTLCTMTTLWSTQSRQRTECLRSSTSFTVSLDRSRHVGKHCTVWQDVVKVKATHCVFCRSHFWGQCHAAAEVHTVLPGHRHPPWQHRHPA